MIHTDKNFEMQFGLDWFENMTSFIAVSDLSISSFEDQVRSFEDQVEERPLTPPPTTGKSPTLLEKLGE